MNAMPLQSKPAVLSVRLSATERAMLQAAAEQAHTTISDYVRRKALVEAEIDMMNRRKIEIPAEDWDSFMAWADSPPEDIPALRKLLATRSVWKE
jgi:uncharacterized protein (DUF1778 family)